MRKNGFLKWVNRLNPNTGVVLPPQAPKFMIIGAQKAGTTALYTYLSRHPEVAATETKELHFFNCPCRYSRGLEYYHSLFPRVESHPSLLTFDASPGYLHHGTAYRNIYRYNPQLKIIALLRNPIDRAFSAWSMYGKRYERNRNWYFDDWVRFCNGENEEAHFSRRRIQHFSSFEYVVQEEIEYLSANRKTVLEAPIVTHGLYHEQLSRYYSLFPATSICIIESDHFRNHTHDVLRQIELFLGLSPHEWEKENLSPVFTGEYRTDCPQQAKAILREYYRTSNDKLFKLINRTFDWDESHT